MSGFPKYRQVYEALRLHITEGRYRPGEMLPSENELCRLYGLTRPTVRKALDMLSSDGTISIHHGKRSVVKGVPKEIGILSLLSTTSAVGQTDIRTEIIVKPEARKWSEAFTYRISEEEKAAGCIYFERVRILDGVPVILDITMLPNIGISRFSSYNLENASLFNLLWTKYHIKVTGGMQHLFAIPANKQLREQLHVRAGSPILQLNRRIETSRNGFHIYSQIFCVTNGYSLTGVF